MTEIIRNKWACAAMLSKSTPKGITRRLTVGTRIADTMVEAKGLFLEDVQRTNPGFSIDDLLAWLV